MPRQLVLGRGEAGTMERSAIAPIVRLRP